MRRQKKNRTLNFHAPPFPPNSTAMLSHRRGNPHLHSSDHETESRALSTNAREKHRIFLLMMVTKGSCAPARPGEAQQHHYLAYSRQRRTLPLLFQRCVCGEFGEDRPDVRGKTCQDVAGGGYDFGGMKFFLLHSWSQTCAIEKKSYPQKHILITY